MPVPSCQLQVELNNQLEQQIKASSTYALLQLHISLLSCCTPAAHTVTYTPGSIVSVTTKITVNHGGWLGVSICPSAVSGAGLSQGCFDSYRLTK